MGNGTKRPTTWWLTFCLACFEVISTLPYGLALSIDPTGGLVAMDVDMLAGSPFQSFLVPGLILLIVLGGGALLLATALYRMPEWSWATFINPFPQHHWIWSATIVYGFALMTWITTEVIMIGFDSWLQPLHFAVGLAFALLPWTPSMRAHLLSTGRRPAAPVA